MSFSDIRKDPFDVLERELDWTDVVPVGSTISTSAWASDSSGLTVVDAGTTGLKTKVKTSAGSAGVAYKVSNQVILDSGLKFERSFYVLVREL